jgi:hypothetical protein
MRATDLPATSSDRTVVCLPFSSQGELGHHKVPAKRTRSVVQSHQPAGVQPERYSGIAHHHCHIVDIELSQIRCPLLCLYTQHVTIYSLFLWLAQPNNIGIQQNLNYFQQSTAIATCISYCTENIAAFVASAA